MTVAANACIVEANVQMPTNTMKPTRVPIRSSKRPDSACESVYPSKNVVTTRPDDTVRHVIATLKQHGISQLPVVENGKLRGIVAEVDVLRHLVSGEGHLDGTIAPIIESDYATVSPDTRIELMQGVLNDAKVALVTEGEALIGLVSKIDLIDFLARKAAA